MTDCKRVLLEDGRIGRIVRVDTEFPGGITTVSVWMETSHGPTVAKVGLAEVRGAA
jgi:hypothetical protein